MPLPGKILFDAESVFQSIVNDVANSGGNNRWDCTLRGALHVNPARESVNLRLNFWFCGD